MRNRPEYLEALLAIWHAGLVAVPVNARLHREETAYILEHSESAVVVTDAGHAGDVEPLAGTIASLKAAVVAPGDRSADAGAPPAGRDLDQTCLDHIARFKRPKDYRFVDALPTNNYGKVVKRELRDLLRAEAVDNPDRIPRRPVP
jgi:acyl-CoA synthetase (AMP-forming)/AMP-acid ligase II